MAISIYDPRTMGKLVERMPKVHTFIKSTFFRNMETFDTQKIDVDFKKGNRQLAPFVHKKIGGATIDNEGYQTNTYEPPLVAPNKITTVDDILKRTPGESLYNGKSPNQRAVEKMQRDFTELDEMITRREEWMCCQALFTGKIPILDKDGKELQAEIDFNFTNKETLAAAKKWNAVQGGKIKQLKEWRKQVQKTGFVNCNVCLMGADALEAFLTDEEVQKVLDVRRFEVAVIAPKELPNGATYVGTIHELAMDIYTYNEWYLDNWTDKTKPEDKPLLPANVVALLSTEASYSMYYGAVGVVDETGKSIGVAEGARIPEQWVKRSPARRFLQLNSAPLCVPHEVDSWFVAIVC
ncbi:MAG: major capsid protein [Paludibacter sp.]|nr:major capsid protein [Paludibacter sp.]